MVDAAASRHFDQHLLCGGACKYHCHRRAVGTWSYRPRILESFVPGGWRGNWSDGTHGEGLQNEWCPFHTRFNQKLLYFPRAALRDCLKNRHIVFVGDSSMRIFFSALVSMVNGTREWDTPDPALSSWRIPYEPPERRASTCDNRLDEEHDVGLPCFREFSAHGVRLTFVWKTFVRDRPTPGRAQAGKWYNRTLFFSDLLLNGSLSRSPGRPDLLVAESGLWDHYDDHPADEPGGPPNTLRRMIGEWVRGLRERFDGPIIWAQPTPGADHRLALYDQILRDLRLPVLWRRPTYRPRPPPGFPRHYLRGVHNPDVLAIEHANMLLSAVCT